MSKRIISYALIVIFTFSVFPYASAQQVKFPDLEEGHWAYSAVEALVADGTVRGFEDGSFKPNNTVSRAEFVKMIGKGPEKRTNDFSDVTSSHWSYEYIMYSGLEGAGDLFNPDAAITRNDVLDLIWKRNGSKTGVIAPSVISSQGTNKNAAAWGYTYGIMVGNDGLNLRLGDSLSRAEAAVLIIRARGIGDNSATKNFIDTVSPKVLENVYNSIKLLNNIPYSADKTLTYGEMARAAVRLGSEEFDLTYRSYTVEKPFEHDYAKDLYVVGKESIGEDKVSLEYADKPATVQDTLTALTYSMIRKSHSPVKYGKADNYYKDIASVNNKMANICLTYAFDNGVQLYADGTLNPQKPVTLKEFSALLLQLDSLIGSQSEITTEYSNGIRVVKNSKIRKSVDTYPGNYTDFQCILENIPNEVYEVPFADNAGSNKPKASYDFAREYSIIFTSFYEAFKSSVESGASGVKLKFTHYPSLICDNGNGATMRVKCEILDNPNNLSVKEIFKDKINIENDVRGKAFFIDIVSGQTVSDVTIPTDEAVIKQVVYIIEQ